MTTTDPLITTTRIQRSHYLLLRAGALLTDALGASLLMIIPGSIASGFALFGGAQPKVLNAIWWSTGLLLVVMMLLRDGTKGRSPGKHLLGLTLHTATGRKCGYLRSIGRNLPLLVPGVILIEAILVLFTARSRRLGDRLARTTVIEE